MSLCKHCSTPVKSSEEDFCCRGCESVFQLIHEDGLGLFYDLKADDTLTPLRERPFQQKDWSWLTEAGEAQNNQSVASLTVGLSGMSCMACVWLVETVAKKQKGVLETCADNTQGSFEFSYDVAICDLNGLANTLHKLGYELLPKKLGQKPGTTESLVVRLGICGALAMNTMAFTLPRYNGMETTDELSSLLGTVVIASSTLTLLIGGSYFFKRAWSALRLGGIHMDLPISLGLLLSYFGSIVGWATGHEDLFYFDFVAIFTFLMLLGKQLQISSLNKANSRFQTDTTIPEFYRTVEGDEIDTVALEADMALLVPPGTVIPVDSRLLSDSADLSLAWITGEPSSQLFHHTAAIPAGAVNQSSSNIQIQTNKATSEDDAISRLLATDIKQSSNSNRQAQQRAIQIYLFVIIVLGFIAGLTWWFTSHDWVKSLQVLISIYVVSCPCGIGLALPLLDSRSSKHSHTYGIFPLTSRFWEHLTRVGKVVFDKTGTLTLDKPELVDKSQLTDLSQTHNEILFSLTRSSLHPLSRSIFSELIKSGITYSSHSEQPVETPGTGNSITLTEGDFTLGRSPRHTHQDENLSCTFSLNGTEIVTFRFRESARDNASDAIESLNKELQSPCMILSGDDSDRVRAVAQKLHIPEYYGNLLPRQKKEHVDQLELSQRVLFLGDGVNDLPALQSASLSGAPFANINMLTADVDFLFTDETMTFLPKLIRIARQRRRRKINLISYTIIYNATALSFCVAGMMSPLYAAIIMPLSSLVSIAIISKPFTSNNS